MTEKLAFQKHDIFSNTLNRKSQHFQYPLPFPTLEQTSLVIRIATKIPLHDHYRVYVSDMANDFKEITPLKGRGNFHHMSIRNSCIIYYKDSANGLYLQVMKLCHLVSRIICGVLNRPKVEIASERFSGERVQIRPPDTELNSVSDFDDLINDFFSD